MDQTNNISLSTMTTLDEFISSNIDDIKLGELSSGTKEPTKKNTQLHGITDISIFNDSVAIEWLSQGVKKHFNLPINSELGELFVVLSSIKNKTLASHKDLVSKHLSKNEIEKLLTGKQTPEQLTSILTPLTQKITAQINKWHIKNHFDSSSHNVDVLKTDLNNLSIVYLEDKMTHDLVRKLTLNNKDFKDEIFNFQYIQHLQGKLAKNHKHTREQTRISSNPNLSNEEIQKATKWLVYGEIQRMELLTELKNVSAKLKKDKKPITEQIKTKIKTLMGK